MANIIKKRNKHGELVYNIRVYSGKDERGKYKTPFATTFHPEPGWSESKADKEAERFAAIFENDCKKSGVSSSATTFEEYAEKVLAHKESSGILKTTTASRYRSMTGRIYPTLGKKKLKDITPQILNEFYDYLLNCRKSIEASAIPKKKFLSVYKRSGFSYERLQQATNVSIGTICDAVHGKPITESRAKALSEALEFDLKDLFTVTYMDEPLSTKTVLEYHRFISSILAQAEKELLVPYNAAAKATPPKVRKRKVNYFEPDTIKEILAAFDQEPIYRKAIGYLLVYSGARRGEVLGLEWKNVNFDKHVISFEKNLLYVHKRGTYVDTLKTEMSERTISLPQSAFDVLQEYKEEWYDKVKELAGDEWEDNGFVFVTETGRHTNPSAVSSWLTRVEEKYGLPHLNAHAFRHSVASALIFAGVDPVSVSRRLGHNQVSTTTNIYAHIMSKADERNAEILDELF